MKLKSDMAPQCFTIEPVCSISSLKRVLQLNVFIYLDDQPGVFVGRWALAGQLDSCDKGWRKECTIWRHAYVSCVRDGYLLAETNFGLAAFITQNHRDRRWKSHCRKPQRWFAVALYTARARANPTACKDLGLPWMNSVYRLHERLSSVPQTFG